MSGHRKWSEIRAERRGHAGEEWVAEAYAKWREDQGLVGEPVTAFFETDDAMNALGPKARAVVKNAIDAQAARDARAKQLLAETVAELYPEPARGTTKRTCIVCKEEFDVADSWTTGAGLLLDRGNGEDAICCRCVRDATLHEYLYDAWAYSPQAREALETIRIAGGKPKEAR